MLDKYRNVKRNGIHFQKKSSIECKGETLFKLDKDGHYILYYILSDITLCYIILLVIKLLYVKRLQTSSNWLSKLQLYWILKQRLLKNILIYNTEEEWKIYLIMTTNFFIKRFWKNFWLAQNKLKDQKFFDSLKVRKIFQRNWLAQIQQNDRQFLTC